MSGEGFPGAKFPTAAQLLAALNSLASIPLTVALSVPLGSAAAPSISFTGDATTGFYSAGAGKIDVAISGAKVAEWTSTGLDVYGTSNARRIGFNFFASDQWGLYTDGNTDAAKMSFRKGTTDYAYFDASGNLTLGGTTSIPILTLSNTTTASSTWALKHLANGDLQLVQPSQNTWYLFKHATGMLGALGTIIAGSQTDPGLGAVLVAAGDVQMGRSGGSQWLFQSPSTDLRIVGQNSGAHLALLPAGTGKVLVGTSSDNGLGHLFQISGGFAATAASQVDIGTASGARPAGAIAAPLNNTAACFFATDGNFPRVWGESYGTATGFVLTGRNINGTRAAPTATAANSGLLGLTATGYDGTNYLTAGRAQYAMFAGSLWTTSNHETYHEWRCTPNGSTTNTIYMRLMGGGRLLVGTTLPTDDGSSALQVVGAATFNSTVKVGTSVVASLPAAGTAGRLYFATNGRKNGEGAGSGTGVLVFDDGTAWRACDTGATVAA